MILNSLRNISQAVRRRAQATVVEREGDTDLDTRYAARAQQPWSRHHWVRTDYTKGTADC